MKKETRLSRKVRESLYRDFGIILHKTHGGAFGETGAADLYGTLPGGRAVYVELKTPETINKHDSRRAYQDAWLRRERNMGALTAVVDSYEKLHDLLLEEGIHPPIGFRG